MHSFVRECNRQSRWKLMKDRNYRIVFFYFSSDDFNSSRISLSLTFNDRESSDKTKENTLIFSFQISSHNFYVNSSSLKTHRRVFLLEKKDKKPLVFDAFFLSTNFLLSDSIPN